MTEPTEQDIERALANAGPPIFEAVEDRAVVAEAMADDVTTPALAAPDTEPDPLTPQFQEPPGTPEI